MQTFWDPTGATVTEKTFEKQYAELQQKLSELQADPLKLRRILIYIILISILFAIVTTYLSLTVPRNPNDGDIFGLFIIPFIPPLVYMGIIKNLEHNLALFLFAKSKNWVFNRGETLNKLERWEKYADAFPQIFEIGNARSQRIEKELWGNIEIDGTKYGFWKAPFRYSIGVGDSARTLLTDAIIFHLHRKIKAHLVLAPEGFKLFGKEHDDLKTESDLFNNTFKISCPGMDEAKKNEIVRALSPAVIEKLLALKHSRGAYSLLLRDDVLVFRFNNYHSPICHTNFFKKVEIDQRDLVELQKDFESMLSATGDLLKHLR